MNRLSLTTALAVNKTGNDFAFRRGTTVPRILDARFAGQWHDDPRRSRWGGATGSAPARVPADACDMAPGRASARGQVHRYLPRSPRLWRQRQALLRRTPRVLLETGDSARPARADAHARLRALRARRARP